MVTVPLSEATFVESSGAGVTPFTCIFFVPGFLRTIAGGVVSSIKENTNCEDTFPAMSDASAFTEPVLSFDELMTALKLLTLFGSDMVAA